MNGNAGTPEGTTFGDVTVVSNPNDITVNSIDGFGPDTPDTDKN